jgi:2'-hydroxyisoflavone reductase
MRILVIGGTSFVGRAIVDRALERDHDVTLFNRGQTSPDVFPDATHLTGDRDSDLSALESGEWDATVDVCGYAPRQVRSLLDVLGERSGHYTFVSTISVYGDLDADEVLTEDSPLLEPAWDEQPDMAKYGELKVACEQVAQEVAGDRLLIVRPGFVIGPHDSTHRFTYWVERVAAGEPFVGGDAEQPLQAVDARDLAAFTVGGVERQLRETVHVTAPDDPPTFESLFAEIAEGLDKTVPEVSWLGPRDELPLTFGKEGWPMMHADLSRAKDHGLWWRPFGQTARDTLDWVREEREAGRYSIGDRYGLPAETERSLIHANRNG